MIIRLNKTERNKLLQGLDLLIIEEQDSINYTNLINKLKGE